MEKNVDLARNKIFHLENSKIMHGIYNTETTEIIVNTKEKVHKKGTWNDKLILPRLTNW